MEQDMLIPLDKFEEEKGYWLRQLSGKSNQIRLLKDFPEENNFTSAGFNGHIEKQVTQEIMRISKGIDLSLFVILLTSFKILLFKYTGQKEIIVASPAYSREAQRYNPMVVFRDFVNPGMTFKDLLLNVKQTVTEGYNHQFLPIKQLIHLLSIENPDSRVSLFRNILLLENIHDGEPVRRFIRESESDIVFSLRRTDGELEIHVTYNAGLFKKETISRLVDSFNRILSQVSGSISITIKDIDVISEEEKAEVLTRFNSPGVEYPGEKSVHGVFVRQVERTPGYTALCFQEHHFTYYLLHRLSDGIACCLEGKGVGPNFIVGLMMSNSLEMVAGILGILKAGGAYLPIDPDYPAQRKNYLILDSNAKLLLVDTSPGETSAWDLTLPSASVISFSQMNLTGYSDPADCSYMAASAGSPADLAYVVYTSGTTGNPKGVLIEHRGIVNYINWRLDTYRYTGRDVTLQLLSYCFDGFVSNFYSSLLSGGILILIPDDRKLDYDYISRIIKMRCVTNTSLVPGMYEALLGTAGADDLASIRFLVLAGERANPNLLYESKKRYPHIMHINEYGPTEGTVTAAANTNMNMERTGIIGKPISNTHIYLFTSDGKLAPLGVAGELAIQGQGMSRGYLNRPVLTAEKFNRALWNYQEYHYGYHRSYGSYRSNWSDIIYKTGDLARWQPDGDIEFLGRSDHQVKIRGYRVELGEIENLLLRHGKIKNAVVIARDGATQRKTKRADMYLCAYITAGEKLNTDELQEFLSKKLPGYMLPSYFLQVEQIPLTANGKVDGHALPLPGTGVPFTAPRNETEDKLAQIWSQILDIEKCRIGIDDNFFQLGGHSLKVMLQAAKIHREFDVKIPLTDFFKIRTIRELSEYIDGTKEEPFTTIAPVEERDFYELSPAQKRMYIIHRMIGTSTAYNIPGIILLEGRIEKQELNTSFKKLITRHESLRTSFKLIEGRPVQKVHKNVNFEIEYHDINEVEIEKEKQVTGKNPPTGINPPDGLPAPKSRELRTKSYINSFFRPFDLSQAPLLRVGLLEAGDQRHTLMVDMHHIISDGMSMEVFIQDFTALYSGGELPALRLHYKDFAHWLRDPGCRAELEKQETYWLKLFETVPPPLELPTDFPRPAIQSYEGSSLEFTLGKKETRLIKNLARVEGATMFMVLLAIYTILLARLTGRHDIVVGVPIIGRRHADLEKILGIFINALAFRNNVPSELTFVEFLREVKRNTLNAFENQDYPFEDLVEKVLKHRHGNRNSLFDARFNMDSFEILPRGFGKLKLKPYPQETTTSKFDMTLNARENSEILSFELEYCSKLFKKTTIEKFIGYFREITTAVVENPGNKLGDIELSLDLSILETGMEMDEVSRMKLKVERQQPQSKAADQPPPTSKEEVEPVYCPPRDMIEKKLVEIWSEILEMNCSHIGIDDVFFHLEGQSLKAIMMASGIHKTFNINIPIPVIFQLPTIRGLADHIKKAIMEGAGNIARYASIRPVEKKDYYFLSPAQKRLYILKQLNPGNTAYNMTLVCRVGKKPDKKKLEQVFLQLIKRHEGLRSSFHETGGEVVQRVHARASFSAEYFQGGTDQENETIIRNFVRPFDLSRAPLLRVGLIEPLHTTTAQGTYLLMVDMHHIISDASSHGILSGEFAALYAGEKLPSLRLHYRDYSRWWELPGQQQEAQKQENYWLRQFQGEVPLLDLPTDFERPTTRSFEGNAVEFSIAGDRYTALRELSRISGSTLFIVLMALFNVFLSRLNGQEDIVVGTPVLGRRHADLQGIIGMFVNTLALRNYPAGNKKFIDFLTELKENTLQAFENQDYPFEDLVRHVDTRKDIARNPLFTAMLSMHHLENPDGIETPGLPMELYDYETRSTKFDLLFRVLETPDKLACSFRYCTKLFKEETIRRFIHYLDKILSIVIDNHEIQLKDIVIPREFLEVDTRVKREEFSDFGF